MPKLQLLKESQQKKFDSCPSLTVEQRERYFSFDDEVIAYIDNMKSPINQVGILVQLGYFRASGKFFTNKEFKIADIKFCCLVLEIDYEEITNNFGQYSSKARSQHKSFILQHCGWEGFTKKYHKELHDELSRHAKQQMHPKELLPIGFPLQNGMKSFLRAV